MRSLTSFSREALALFGASALVSAGVLAASFAQPAGAVFPPPLDPQVWQAQDVMTWADYRPIPGTSWADPAKTPERALKVALVAIDVTNTGAAPESPAGHPGAPGSAFASDIYRVSVSVDGAGWEADVQTALVSVRAGESARVPVFARRTSGSARNGRVTVTVVSESDPSKRAVSMTEVKPR